MRIRDSKGRWVKGHSYKKETKFSKLITKDFLQKEYWNNGKSLRKIVEETKCSGILYYMKKFNIPRRKIGSPKGMNKGINRSKKTRRKISNIMQGTIGSKSPAYKHGKYTKDYHNYCLDCGKEIWRKAKRCSSCAKIGKLNGFYNSDLTLEERLVGRNYTEYYNWRIQIFKRDDYTCQKCKCRSGNGKTIKLAAHHIINYAENKKLRLNLDNGITLCKECHLNFHKQFGFRNNNRKQVQEYLKQEVLK